jgi:hypothetical protein
MAGLKISTFWRANLARLIRLMSSSVLPENIEPHTTSILPGLCASPVKFSVIMSAKLQIPFKNCKDFAVFFVYSDNLRYICPS